MKNRRILAVVLMLSLCLNINITSAEPVEQRAVTNVVNPISMGMNQKENINPLAAPKRNIKVIECRSEAEVKAAITSAMKKRSSSVVINYTGSDFVSYYNGNSKYLTAYSFDLICNYILGNDEENDYIKNNLSSFYYNSVQKYANNLIITLTGMGYYTTLQQEQQVDVKVKQIIDTLNLDDPNKPIHQKVKDIYDYECNTITYDTDLEKFSAYDGLITGETVCNGYALIMYRLLKEAGISSRIIAGFAYDEGNYNNGHAWNIVKINGEWYNVDVTWADIDATTAQAASIDYAWFLKNKQEFEWDNKNKMEIHIKWGEYATAEFNKNYPMAEKSYQTNNMISDFPQTLVTGITVTSAKSSMKKDITIQLLATIMPSNANKKGVVWSSSNQNIVSVDDCGIITANKPGVAVIRATAIDGSGIYGEKKITVTQPVTSLKINVKTKTLKKRGKYTLKVTVAPSNATNKKITWKTSNAKVATVSSKGIVTGKAKGTATITATAQDGSGKKITCKITVK